MYQFVPPTGDPVTSLSQWMHSSTPVSTPGSAAHEEVRDLAAHQSGLMFLLVVKSRPLFGRRSGVPCLYLVCCCCCFSPLFCLCCCLVLLCCCSVSGYHYLVCSFFCAVSVDPRVRDLRLDLGLIRVSPSFAPVDAELTRGVARTRGRNAARSCRRWLADRGTPYALLLCCCCCCCCCCSCLLFLLRSWSDAREREACEVPVLSKLVPPLVPLLRAASVSYVRGPMVAVRRVP